MNKALLIVATFAVLLLALAEAGDNHKRALCSDSALLADPYFSLSADWNTNTACTVDGATRTCKIPGDSTFSPASGWRVDGPTVVTNLGRSRPDYYSCQLLESTTLEADFYFATDSPNCALRWQDFTMDDIAYPYQVDIVDSNGNTLGGNFPHPQSTDPDNACDFSGCNYDARNILGWTLPAGGTYTVRFTGTASGEGVGAFLNDICVACMPPSPTPSVSRSGSSSISQSSSSSPSRTPSTTSSLSSSRTPSTTSSLSSSRTPSTTSSLSSSRTPSTTISVSPSSTISVSPSSTNSLSASGSISRSASSSPSSVPSKSASSSISVSPSSSISKSASSSISQSASSSISQSASSSISQSASSSISQSSSASPSSSPVPSPCPSRSASPSPCPEPEPGPCDPCAHKHNKHNGGDITININFN